MSVPQPPGAWADPRRLLGQVLSGRYRVDELVGEGGMGAVYRAEHLHLRKRVAVKVLNPALAKSAEAVARFEREAIAGAHVVHPNVAAASDFGVLDDGSHFLVLEYLEGESLRAVIGRGPLPRDRAIAIARQLALGVGAAHALGIVHRDLKPDNVMLVRGDPVSARGATPSSVGGEVAKVLDFGIAKVPASGLARGPQAAALTQVGMVYGTPEYMAPEQAFGAELDGRADLYALGVVLYEMLSAQRPFDAPDRASLITLATSSPPPSLAPRVPGGITPALDAVVTRLLEKDPQRRFADAAALVAALDALEPPSVRFDHPMTAAMTLAAVPARTGAMDQLVAALPAPLRAVPAPALFAWVGLGAVTALFLLAAAVRSPASLAALEEAALDPAGPASAAASASSAPDEPAPVVTATPAELDAARLSGLAALGPLAQRFPSDPAVLKALLLAHANDKSGWASAVGVARRLFEISPASLADDDVRRVLIVTASGPPEVATQTFDLASAKMGSAGPDLLYELVVTPVSSKPAKDRAAKLLEDPAVRRLATPALLVALDLRASLPCARKALFARAAADGDARAMFYLRPLLATAGCGFIRRSDCYPCFGDRADLRQAVAAIESRAKK